MIAGMGAHFARKRDAPSDDLPKKLKSVASKLRDGNDVAKHSKDSGNYRQLILDEFMDRFSICGSADKCVSRLLMLTNLGTEHVYQLCGSPVAQPHG